MDRELSRLHQGYHDERRALAPDPHDVPGHGRPGGIDDPVPDAEYGDVQRGAGGPEHGPCPEDDHRLLIDTVQIKSASELDLEIEGECSRCGRPLYTCIDTTKMEVLD